MSYLIFRESDCGTKPFGQWGFTWTESQSKTTWTFSITETILALICCVLSSNSTIGLHFMQMLVSTAVTNKNFKWTSLCTHSLLSYPQHQSYCSQKRSRNYIKIGVDCLFPGLTESCQSASGSTDISSAHSISLRYLLYCKQFLARVRSSHFL